MPVNVRNAMLYTDTAKQTMDAMMYLTDGGTPVALLSESVFCLGEKEEKSEEKLEELVQEYTERILSYHPDFESYAMDNDSTLVLMSEAPCGYYLPPSEKEAAFAEKFAARNEVLRALEEGEIIAVYIPQ